MRKAANCWDRHGISLPGEIISGHAGDGFRHIWRSVSQTRIRICHPRQALGILLSPKSEAHYILCRSTVRCMNDIEWWYIFHHFALKLQHVDHARSWSQTWRKRICFFTAEDRSKKVPRQGSHERYEFLAVASCNELWRVCWFAPSLLETSLRQSFGQKRTVKKTCTILIIYIYIYTRIIYTLL